MSKLTLRWTERAGRVILIGDRNVPTFNLYRTALVIFVLLWWIHALVFTFPKNPPIYLALSLKEYLARIAPLWQTDAKSLFVSITKPFKYVTS